MTTAITNTESNNIMTTQTQSRKYKYPLVLAIHAFDLACEYGWKPKATNWNQSFSQALEHRSDGDTCYRFWSIVIDDLPEEDRVDIADTLEQALKYIPDEVVEIGSHENPWTYMPSSLYKENLFYKLDFWSNQGTELKAFIILLRQGANQLSQPQEAGQR